MIGKWTMLFFCFLGWSWHGSAMADDAVSFGQVEVGSAMGEPLHVRIPFQGLGSSTLETTEALWGVPTNYAHQGGPVLKTSIRQENDKNILLIDSDRGMTIPFFTLMIRMVTADRVIIQNLPVFLGEMAQASAAKDGIPSEHDPIQTDGSAASTGSTRDTTREMPVQGWSRAWIWGLSALVLSGGLLLLPRFRRTPTRSGLSRGGARNRPMAVPLSTPRETMATDRDTAPAFEETKKEKNEPEIVLPSQTTVPDPREETVGATTKPSDPETSPSSRSPRSGHVEAMSPADRSKGVKISSMIRGKSPLSGKNPHSIERRNRKKSPPVG
ncbi:MAG: hypothetical protein HQL76_04025 [Magnetococcales bacterium]|nr:hypothetical protein [Magnetococcales bacterium]